MNATCSKPHVIASFPDSVVVSFPGSSGSFIPRTLGMQCSSILSLTLKAPYSVLYTLQAFLGNRYGYRPFPAKISVSDFGILLETALSNQIDAALLNKWYRRDNNVVPPTFQLLPITVHYPNYNSRDSALRHRDRDGWWQTFSKLQQVFWQLAEGAVKGGAMSPDHAHKYFMSGEKQIL